MSNLSAIGFDVDSEEDFERTVGAALNRAALPTELGASAGHYLWFRDPSGAALAARVDSDRALECMTPFFEAPDGGARWRVHTSAPHLDRECLHSSGADCDVLDASGETCTRTALQFLFFEPYRVWLEGARTFVDQEEVGWRVTSACGARKWASTSSSRSVRSTTSRAVVPCSASRSGPPALR